MTQLSGFFFFLLFYVFSSGCVIVTVSLKFHQLQNLSTTWLYNWNFNPCPSE